MFRTLSLVMLASTLTLVGCGGPQAWRRAASNASASQPAPGSELNGILVGLFEPPAGEGHKLEVVELRLLAMGEPPWATLEPGSAAARHGRVGLTTHRICRLREGLTFHRVERASWMIFEDGMLLAWDHGTFKPGCEAGRSYRPARVEFLDLERGLLRYYAQRYPAAWPTLEERLRGGLALLEADRLEDAKRVLKHADGNVTQLSDHTETVFGDEREAAEQRLVIVKALHVKLRRAVRKAEREAAKQADAS
ncbi:MAG: hypothetical protein JRH01_09410 [Deltaproteobacteria bacterium]|nr:hypothetical protein [Deltaproteobacteria bacterium]MBW2393379.1 hypothetical protein [Deltaproteobacteria bacterium]